MGICCRNLDGFSRVHLICTFIVVAGIISCDMCTGIIKSDIEIYREIVIRDLLLRKKILKTMICHLF